MFKFVYTKQQKRKLLGGFEHGTQFTKGKRKPLLFGVTQAKTTSRSTYGKTYPLTKYSICNIKGPMSCFS